ncbi:SDR family NAD(P)-dependent oxidoreductase [Corynebacterium variabile]|uniref:SDR family NAD(P)-dependent oxidoreductase n=1 Tax=Corynebacterium variabile TaxID=1727 RepID=UPI0028EDF251|nr:SDR family NAD(P)-dependent oxidoreductase [Corynebacterium variabile]
MSVTKNTGPRTVLVTGAASGLGLGISRQFLDKGDRVILTDLHEDTPPSVQALSGNWTYRRLNVTRDEDWQVAAAEVDSPDILVSNAGIAIGGRITETKMDTWQKALDINVLGSVRGLRVFVPKIGKGGRIVLTASAAGLVHAPAMATYNATKAATVALGETVDAELRHRKISTTVIRPQFFKSGLADSLTGDDDAMDAVARVLLSRTWLTSEIVARRAVKGIEARRTVVTPDGFATFSWYSRRFTRIPYLFLVRAIGWAVARQVRRSEGKALV